MLATLPPYDREGGSLLERAYHALYEREFPDPNERESLENMKDYLFKKDNGTWGAGDYHIGVIEIEGEPAAMSVCDYFAEPCTGAIEFLVVDSRHRGRALGKLLLGWTERRLKSDARRHSKRELRAIVAEMNDPFMRSEVRDNLDPFERCLIWHRWGYRLLDMPYSQPALSGRQKPVRNLVLIAKVFANGDCADTTGPQAEAKVEAIDAELVRATVMEYLKLAMRIEHPEQCREYVETATFLGSRDREQRGVPGISLGRYIGRCLDDGSELSIAEVTLGDPDFDGVMALYDEYFPEGETRIQHHEFLAFVAATFRQDNETTRARRWRIFGRLAEGRHRAALLAKSQFHYHLWAIRFAGNTSVDGVASFFTLRVAGFGGYVAFRKSGVARPGRLRALIARIEEQIIRDSSIAAGWFIEVDPERSRLIEHFKQHGFFMVDAEYVQPTIAMDTEAPVQTKRLRLMYKPLGRVYTKPTLDREVAESWHAELLEIVYGLSRHSRAFKVLDSAWCAQLRSKAPARLLE
ncbi:MAG TPA: GNAT family N-acetyltransferase [Blastocatellia bacterium]|nr:GNAT family N-acetyltransferase [Blastocatellia bacterium]